MWSEITARLHLTAANQLEIAVGLLAMALTCRFCWVRGEQPDRIGAVVFAVCWIGGLTVEMIYIWFSGGERPPLLSDVVWDGGLALAFLSLALRSNNLWFGAVALVQGVQLALVAADQAMHEPVATPLAAILIRTINLLNFAMMAAMIGSAVQAMRRRRRTAPIG